MSGQTESGESRKAPISGDRSLGAFTGRLLVVVVIAALAAALWRIINVLMLLFGAILLAIGLHAGLLHGCAELPLAC